MSDTPSLSHEVVEACERASGATSIPDDARPRRVRGAWNDFNSRGRGDAYCRRVLRNGRWQWFCEPASQGRFRADDRHDSHAGDVFAGEIVTEFTLGQRGKPKPSGFWLVTEETKALTSCVSQSRRDGRYAVTLPTEITIIVDDPAWR